MGDRRVAIHHKTINKLYLSYDTAVDKPTTVPG